MGTCLAATSTRRCRSRRTAGPRPGAQLLGGVLWPAFRAFALCCVVPHTATSKDVEGNSYDGLVIGFTVTAGVVAVGAISPAVTFGLMLGGFFSWKFLWVSTASEVLGAVLAALAYKGTSLNPQTGQ